MYFLKGFPDILFVYCHSFLAHLNEVGGPYLIPLVSVLASASVSQVKVFGAVFF